MTRSSEDDHVRMCYELVVTTPEDRRILSWLPVGRGWLRVICIPSWSTIPAGDLLITITRGTSTITQMDAEPLDVMSHHNPSTCSFECVTYRWLSAPRRGVWWATGRPYSITTEHDTREYSRLFEAAAHGDSTPLLRRLFGSLE